VQEFDKPALDQSSGRIIGAVVTPSALMLPISPPCTVFPNYIPHIQLPVVLLNWSFVFIPSTFSPQFLQKRWDGHSIPSSTLIPTSIPNKQFLGRPTVESAL
jgi:hypothetical protein